MNEVHDLAVDGIHAFDGAFVGRPSELRFFDFVEGLFGQPASEIAVDFSM